ncbi:monocyte differentiation antigen CD14 [Pyxicephalus adspersus]|uniref:monocyte differentiation antigen CD14 n=1 Tax=Pyxicephalus adspersus TaxID=30357 RepID=UPI003B59B237
MMKISHSLFFIFLFLLKIPSLEADCSYDESLRHCSCSHFDLTNIMSIASCIRASSFEFSKGNYVNAEHFITYNFELQQVLSQIQTQLTKVSFVNVVLSQDFLFAFIKWLEKIPIILLAFENTTFVGQYSLTMGAQQPRISSLQFINVSSNPLIQTDSVFHGLGNWMSTLSKLTVEKSDLKTIPCNISMDFKYMSDLDLSENLLQEESLTSSFCNGAFPNLKILKLRHNNLVKYESVCRTLRNYNLLANLDLSQNNFSSLSNYFCEWQPSLVRLNLSSTGLEHVDDGLPKNCEVLDLRYNKIEVLNISLPRLKELYLSYNAFTTISPMGNLPSLQVLAVDGNLIETLSRGQLQNFEHLRSFKGDNNPYSCSCSFVIEMKEIAETDWIIQKWPEGYICNSPPSFKDMLVDEVNRSFFECHTHLLIVLICIIILLLTIAIIICFVKIHRSNKTRSTRTVSGNSNSVQF